MEWVVYSVRSPAWGFHEPYLIPRRDRKIQEGGVALALHSLQKAVSALAAVVAKSDDVEFMNNLDDVARSAIKAGVVQHFEFTYELCWKFIKRWLEANIGATVADGVTRRELFRLAAENRLLDADPNGRRAPLHIGRYTSK